jgi:hypothetical protein
MMFKRTQNDERFVMVLLLIVASAAVIVLQPQAINEKLNTSGCSIATADSTRKSVSLVNKQHPYLH